MAKPNTPPRPWRRNEPLATSRPHPIILSADGEIVCEVYPGPHFPKLGPEAFEYADRAADLIVAAVNAYGVAP